MTPSSSIKDNEDEIAFEFVAMEAVFTTTLQLMRKQMGEVSGSSGSSKSSSSRRRRSRSGGG